MGEIIPFGHVQELQQAPKPKVTIDNKTFDLPQTGAEYLVVVKETLIDEDYRDILCGILDIECYHELPSSLKKIVDSYYSFID